MRHIIENFFQTYPDTFLLHTGIKLIQLNPGLAYRLDDYRDRQQFIVGEAQYFRIDEEAEWMRRIAIQYDRCPKVFLSAVALAATVMFWLWRENKS